MRRIHVMAAVIRDPQRRILIARRPDNAHQGGLWEFPGGKLEADETRLDGLRRELREVIQMWMRAMLHEVTSQATYMHCVAHRRQ